MPSSGFVHVALHAEPPPLQPKEASNLERKTLQPENNGFAVASYCENPALLKTAYSLGPVENPNDEC